MKAAALVSLVMLVATAALGVATTGFVLSAAANYPNVWLALQNPVDAAEALLFAAVGALIVVRRGTLVGWLLSAMGLVLATMAATAAAGRMLPPSSYADLANAPIWLVPWWAFLGSVGWLVVVSLLAVFGQVFPTGRPLSSRWRAGLVLTLAWPIAFVAVAVFSPVTIAGGKDIPNPNGLTGLPGDLLLALKGGLAPLTLVVAATALTSVIVRFRRSAGRERAQLKWFAYGAAVSITWNVFSALLLSGDASSILNGLVISVLPLTVAAAILRHGLYDIDLLINRTLVYAATTAAIGLAFFGGIVVLQGSLRAFTGGSELAVAITTLGCFGLFQPLRRRIQQAVDRRFYRSRYDAARILDHFSGVLATEVDLDAVRADLLDSVGRTVQPTSASLWLRPSAAHR